MWSKGALHHTPDIAAARGEIYRVLRPGCQSRMVLYHRGSLHYALNQVPLQGVVKRQLLSEAFDVEHSVEQRRDLEH